MNFKNKKILAIDYGQKFTGLAEYSPGRDPFVLLKGRIRYQDDTSLAQEIKSIIEDEFVDIVIVGVPYLLDGQETTMTKTVKSFIEELKKYVSPEIIHQQDETLSSYEAKERMKTSPRFNFEVDVTQVDSMSASIILEEFYNKNKGQS